MSKRNLIVLALCVVVIAQLAVPASLIIKHEMTLQKGEVFLFKTRPVDPVDAFRGRYVWLGLEPASVKVPDVQEWTYKQKVFAVLGRDTNGVAVVQRLEHAKPEGEPSVQVRVGWHNNSANEVSISWPGLDRYYMTEKKAPAAESAYRNRSTRENQTCFVKIRVLNGHAVIEDLLIEGQSISDWLKNQ